MNNTKLLKFLVIFMMFIVLFNVTYASCRIPGNDWPWLYKIRVQLYDDKALHDPFYLGLYSDGMDSITVTSGGWCGRDDFDGCSWNDAVGSVKIYDSGGAGKNPCDLYEVVFFRKAPKSWGWNQGALDENLWNCGDHYGSDTSLNGQNFMDNAYSGLGYRYKSIDTTAAACDEFACGRWTGSDCCIPGETSFKNYNNIINNQFCYNAALYYCKDASNPAGTLRGPSLNYLCLPNGQWVNVASATQEEKDKKICAGMSTNNINSDISQIFLDSSKTSDNTNRCCGNAAADYGYITTDSISGVTVGKWLCDKDASGWKWKAANDATLYFMIKNMTNRFYTVPNGNSWQVCQPANTNLPNAFTGVPSGFSFTATGIQSYVDLNNINYGFEAGTQIPSAGSSQVSISTIELAGAVSAEQFMNDFSQVTIYPLQETETSSDGVSITIIPPTPKRNEIIKLRISGLPPLIPPSVYKIINSTGYGILIKNGNDWVKAYHDPETISDSDARFGFDNANPFYVAIPSDLVEGKHLLNITVLQQAGGSINIYKVYNKTFTITQPPMATSTTPFSINPAKFFCYAEPKTEIGTKIFTTGVITECCGPNYAYCMNKNKNVSRIAGGPTGLLKDYYGSNGRNNVYRRIFDEKYNPSNTIKDLIEIKDLSIRNWNLYDNLEFDMFAAGSTKLNISVNITPTIKVSSALYGTNCAGYNPAKANVITNLSQACDGNVSCSYKINYVKMMGDPKVGCSKNYIAAWTCDGTNQKSLTMLQEANGKTVTLNCTKKYNQPVTISFDDSLLKYSTTGNELNKWHHISIPVTNLLKSGRINYISFYVNQKQLTDELGEFDLDTYGSGSSPTLIGVRVGPSTACKTLTGCKRINISNNYYLTLIGLDRFFLSNSETNFCASDYDPYRGGSMIGKWVNDLDLTGTGAEDACNNVASYGWTGHKCCGDDQGRNEFWNETYNDNKAGCWNGMTVRNNTVIKI